MINKWAILFAFLCILFGMIIIYDRYQIRRILGQLRKMIDNAIDGRFQENLYDETKVSAIEVKLKQFLDKKTKSLERLSIDKNNIKTLISDISHQTKTPVANILLYTQLLSEQEFPKELADYLIQIETQTEKLDFLIQSLIKTSRLENGILLLSPTENFIEDIIEEGIKTILYKAQKKKIEISVELKKGDKAIFDKKWTIEALANLVDNAVKYTKEGDTILIKGIPYDLFYRIDVIDHGIGILEEEITNIFKRFYRSERVREEEGVGIGLYLTREIITKQGGYIKVSSKWKKESRQMETIFSVFLPIGIWK